MFALITEAEFPALYRAADNRSLTSQRQFLRATRLRLILLVAAGLLGTLAWHGGSIDVTAVLAASAFAVAIVVETYLLRTRPERAWYDGRAAAESAKTLTWRFLVGGHPFPVLTDDGPDLKFLDRLRQVATDMQNANLLPVADSSQQVTAKMREVRLSSLEDRKQLYLASRIEDQRGWYTGKAVYNEQRATVWSVALVAAEASGLVGAILRAAAIIDVDILALAGAVAAAITSWVQTKQHQTLARAYSVASYELSDIKSRADRPMSEGDWAHFVDQAEEAISREHTLWRASHS